MSARATITDVARLAGVSKVTVSYVLNGRGTEARISVETQKRVVDAAAELHYSPNVIARSMLSGRLDTLGVVFQHAAYFADRSDFTMDLMLGVTTGALQCEHNLMLHTKPVKDAAEEAVELMNGSVSGVLVLRDEDDPVVNILLDRGFPVVLFFSRVKNPAVPFVDADNWQGGRLATQHLLDLGHTRLGMVTGPPHSRSSADRLAGFRSVLAERGKSYYEQDILTLDIMNVEGLKTYLDRPGRPTAVFCYSDLYAFHLLRAAAELGISVPGDLSVVGFDSVDACERSAPPLTSVRQPVAEIAVTAVQILSRLTKGQRPEKTQVTFGTSLDVRSSTAPPRSG